MVWTDDSFLQDVFEDMFGDQNGQLHEKEMGWLQNLFSRSIYKVWSLRLGLDDPNIVKIFDKDFPWVQKCFIQWYSFKIRTFSKEFLKVKRKY